jgi:hypothetical protein
MSEEKFCFEGDFVVKSDPTRWRPYQFEGGCFEGYRPSGHQSVLGPIFDLRNEGTCGMLPADWTRLINRV